MTEASLYNKWRPSWKNTTGHNAVLVWGTVMAQDYGGKVEEVLTFYTSNLRTAGVGYYPLPTW